MFNQNTPLEITSEKKAIRLRVDFTEGYSFRKTFEYLKQTNGQGNLLFFPNEIIYTETDENRTLLNDIRIQTCDLTKYDYNSDEESIAIGFTLSELVTITKHIGKKDSLLICLLHGDPNVYLQIIGANNKACDRGSVYILRSQNINPQIIYPYEYDRAENNPNCAVPISDFCKMCSAMNSLKCNSVTIKGYPYGICFEGIRPGNITGRIDRFGNCEMPLQKTLSLIKPSTGDDGSSGGQVQQVRLNIRSPSNEVKIQIPISTIKALSKLNNITPGGVIKFYTEQDKALKLICNIGCYGKLTILLNDCEC
jgi:hypothetical protein